MNITKTKIPDILIIKPKKIFDKRGFFQENWNSRIFKKKIGQKINFVQENYSYSKKGVIRGLHYQLPKPQGKLVSVLKGKILDVAVDLRKSSKTYGKFITIELSEKKMEYLWVPSGFAHGFKVLSDSAVVCYKVTDYYNPKFQHCIKWNDKTLKIKWKIEKSKPIISKKDNQGKLFKETLKFL
jgi:dTDP-4-dehydrorhamnose 3,5-epimerase